MDRSRHGMAQRRSPRTPPGAATTRALKASSPSTCGGTLARTPTSLVLTWGLAYHQKDFFEGKVNPLDKRERCGTTSRFRAFSHAGHLVLLRLTEDDYPGTRLSRIGRVDFAILQWAVAGVVGYCTRMGARADGIHVRASQLRDAEDGRHGANEYPSP
jgi:hypothetical protein